MRSQTEYTPIQDSVIHNSAKLEATVFIKKRMDKQNVVPTYNRILFGLKTEGKCDSSHNMNELEIIIHDKANNQDKYYTISVQ